MTTDQALEILNKVTTLPVGLFAETESRKVGTLTSKTFYCDVEGDDYQLLINGKDEVIEIKCSSNTWRQEHITALTTAPVAAPAPAPPTAAGLPAPSPRNMPGTRHPINPACSDDSVRNGLHQAQSRLHPSPS